jgi:hypothetical protein
MKKELIFKTEDAGGRSIELSFDAESNLYVNDKKVVLEKKISFSKTVGFFGIVGAIGAFGSFIVSFFMLIKDL